MTATGSLRGLLRVRAGLAIGVILAVTAVGPASFALAGVVRGYPRSHYCPSFKLDGARYRVTVLKGDVRCSVARKVFRDFISGKGKLHGPSGGPASSQSWTLDSGWSCGRGAGGGACIRGGKNYKVAPRFIEADYVR